MSRVTHRVLPIHGGDPVQRRGYLLEPGRDARGRRVVTHVAPGGIGDAVPRERRGVQGGELVRARAEVRGGGHERISLRCGRRPGTRVSVVSLATPRHRPAFAFAVDRGCQGGELIEMVQGSNPRVEIGELWGGGTGEVRSGREMQMRARFVGCAEGRAMWGAPRGLVMSASGPSPRLHPRGRR